MATTRGKHSKTTKKSTAKGTGSKKKAAVPEKKSGPLDACCWRCCAYLAASGSMLFSSM